MGKARILPFVLWVLPGTLVLCPSCQNGLGGGGIHSQVVDTRQSEATVLKSTTFLLHEPRFLESDYVYPPSISRQRLIWSDRGEEWVLRLAGDHYAFGGIVFRRPYDFSENRSQFALMFSICPADMVPYLAIGLADGERRGACVMTDLPLAECAVRRSGAWAHVTVRLDDFSDEGTVVGGALTADVSGPPSVDWADIREIRLSGLANQRPDREVTIRNLRFEPVRPSSK